ncbi:hypothetical protein AAMO2058_000332900 [Amorphochlora amoebiformis]|uniref:J domain-containing protein n=1 Tax=Amorphochlora amoebiformis TaxID=1561963 RepID=A0A7S0DD79_9EUKA|mmetsp:Transcript_24171/g.38066  ORF Transcript_24171/g.38066 Transcript_24171/m.38066 type:complete len:509 (+) Transcript_24171:115-1641(+)
MSDRSRPEGKEAVKMEEEGSSSRMDKDNSAEPKQLAEMKKNEGNAKFRSGYYREAIRLYTEAIKYNPKEKTYFTNRAMAHFKLRLYAEAAEDCEQAVQLDSKFAKAYQRGAASYCHLGQLDKAEELLKKGNRSNPYDLTIRNEIVKLTNLRKRKTELKQAVTQEKYGRAMLIIPHLEKAITRDLDVGLLVLRTYLGNKTYQRALKYATEWYQFNKSNIELLYLRGKAFYHTGNSSLAQKHFQTVLKNAPDYKPAQDMYRLIKRMNRAKAQGTSDFKSGNYAEAVATYTKALQCDPDNKTFNIPVLSNRAAAYMRLREYEKAVEDLHTVIEDQPENLKAYLRRATCHQELQNHAGAVGDLERACKLDRGNREIRQRLHKAKLAKKKAERKDYYKILGVSQDASDRDLKKAYRKMALKWHPDKNTGSESEAKEAEAKFKDVNEAYQILSDDQKRRRYDAGEDLDDMGGMGGAQGMHPDIFNMFFGGGGMPGQRGRGHGGFGGGGFEFQFG